MLVSPNRSQPSQLISTASEAVDATVVGAGLAGKAASLQLAEAGLKVICISPAESTRPPVGESLDWSAPDLLKALGLPMEYLLETQMATWKLHVTLQMRNGCSEHYVPTPWLGEPPLNIELKTLHLDRARVDEELLHRTVDAGVTLVRDRVVGIERSGKRISSVRTAGGASYSAGWFIDASGIGASVFAREFKLSSIEYVRPRSLCGRIFPSSILCRERPYIWILGLPNTWTGYGRFRLTLKP